MVGIFLLILGYFFIPSIDIKRMLFPYGTVMAFLLFLLGIVLIILTIKQKIKGKLKFFLLLTGISSSGFLVSVLLHNFLYGLGVITGHITILKQQHSTSL